MPTTEGVVHEKTLPELMERAESLIDILAQMETDIEEQLVSGQGDQDAGAALCKAGECVARARWNIQRAIVALVPIEE